MIHKQCSYPLEYLLKAHHHQSALATKFSGTEELLFQATSGCAPVYIQMCIDLTIKSPSIWS